MTAAPRERAGRQAPGSRKPAGARSSRADRGEAHFGAAGAGLAVGLAAAFVVWVLQVRLADMPYHYGFIGAPVLTVDDACREAGWLWLLCSAGGVMAGGAVGILAGTSIARRRLLTLAALASTGIYLLASRGIWGYEGFPPDSEGKFPEGKGPAPMPLISIVLPLALAAVAVAILLRTVRRESRKGSDRPGGAGSTANLLDEGVWGLPLFHLCLSLSAAHLTLQLPYYLGAGEEFLHALPDLVNLIPGL